MTKKGGVHVNAFVESIFRPIVEKFNKRKNKPTITIRDVKNLFQMFVVATVVNPTFTGQNKEELASPKIKAEIKESEIKRLLKWTVIKDLKDAISVKEMKVLKDVKNKKKGFKKIDSLTDANDVLAKKRVDINVVLFFVKEFQQQHMQLKAYKKVFMEKKSK